MCLVQIIERYRNWLNDNIPVLDAQALSALRDEKAGLARTGTPPPRASTPSAESGDATSASDEEKLRQLAAMISDVKVVTQQVTLMWHEEISASAGLPSDVPLEGMKCPFDPLLFTYSLWRNLARLIGSIGEHLSGYCVSAGCDSNTSMF